MRPFKIHTILKELLMSKKLKQCIKLQVPAQKANPSPPVGTALGPAGANIMDFCKAFNERTKTADPGTPIPVVVYIYEDRSFTFVTKTPPASYLLLKAASLSKGSGEPNKKKAGKVNWKQIRKIVEIKKADLNAVTMEAGDRIIAGTARSMGIDVES